MSLHHPQELVTRFSKHLHELQQATEPLSPADQHRRADDLVEVYNYISAQSDKRGSTINAIHVQSARDQRLREMLAEDRKQLEQHHQFVQLNFEHADKYLKTIQLAGYAVLFAAWGVTRESIGTYAGAFSALLMLVSAVIFVVWEIFKATIFSALLRKHAQLSTAKFEEFIVRRSSHFANENTAIRWFASIRVWVWLSCIIPAGTAVLILVFEVFCHILGAIR